MPSSAAVHKLRVGELPELLITLHVLIFNFLSSNTLFFLCDLEVSMILSSSDFDFIRF